MATADHFLDQYLEPLAEALTPEAAQQLLSLTPAPDVAARVASLAEKSNAGTLTPEELDDYSALADAGNLIAILKAKALRVLARSGN